MLHVVLLESMGVTDLEAYSGSYAGCADWLGAGTFIQQYLVARPRVTK